MRTRVLVLDWSQEPVLCKSRIRLWLDSQLRLCLPRRVCRSRRSGQRQPDHVGLHHLSGGLLLQGSSFPRIVYITPANLITACTFHLLSMRWRCLHCFHAFVLQTCLAQTAKPPWTGPLVSNALLTVIARRERSHPAQRTAPLPRRHLQPPIATATMDTSAQI